MRVNRWKGESALGNRCTFLLVTRWLIVVKKEVMSKSTALVLFLCDTAECDRKLWRRAGMALR